MKKIILIGLGALGLTYAVKFKNNKKMSLYVLADKERINKYRKQKIYFNSEEQNFNYILPNERFDADLIIIATKSQGLDSAIETIKNFISERTRIISLINGVSSEEKIKEYYPEARVLKSYFIGHSAERDGNIVTQDGVGELVVEHDEILEEILFEAQICYSVPADIEYSIWLKYTFNLFSNQISAILNMTFGDLCNNKHFIDTAKKIISEVYEIAKIKGIKGIDSLERDALDFLNKMCKDGKTSMLQDVLAKRSTEVDIFAGEIIRLGKKYGIETPYNKVLYDLIKIKEEDNEHSIHTC